VQIRVNSSASEHGSESRVYEHVNQTNYFIKVEDMIIS
jgi:hypothetical protein